MWCLLCDLVVDCSVFGCVVLFTKPGYGRLLLVKIDTSTFVQKCHMWWWLKWGIECVVMRRCSVTIITTITVVGGGWGGIIMLD
jgi:hypothetical protein